MMALSRFPVACLVISSALFVASCNRATQPAVPAPPATIDRQSLDQTVIEAALLDLVTGADEDAETLRREQGKNQILFSAQCRDHAGTLRQELSGSDQWKSLSSADRRAIEQAAADAINRVDTKQ